MATEVQSFTDWLATAHVAEADLSATQRPVLQAAFQFRQRCGTDYYSTRLLSHWLLHCGSGLKVAQVARLTGFSRSAVSAQQGLSSKEVIQAAHHRLAGRSHGKLLPRFAGPIARFLHEQPDATRWDLLDFIQRTWGVSASRMALYRFLKRYGLDRADQIEALPDPEGATPLAEAEAPAAAESAPAGRVAATVVEAPAPGAAMPRPAPEFFLPPRATRAPSCCCPRPLTGSRSPGTASTTPTVRCSKDC
jgi:hypothetical protein